MNENILGVIILLLYFSPIFYQLVIVIKEQKRGNRTPLIKLLKFIKISIFILVSLLIGFGIISHTNYFNYEEPITFNRINEITFRNFRGLEFFKKSLYGNKHFAYVVTSIDSEINDDNVIIQSYFHPSRSYVYNSHSNSTELLSHELYHFRITELYARKAKQRISELKNKSIDNIEDVIKKVKFEEREFQKKYDYDTFHSYVFSEQKKYEKVVDSSLNLLNEYQKPKIKFNDKN